MSSNNPYPQGKLSFRKPTSQMSEISQQLSPSEAHNQPVGLRIAVPTSEPIIITKQSTAKSEIASDSLYGLAELERRLSSNMPNQAIGTPPSTITVAESSGNKSAQYKCRELYFSETDIKLFETEFKLSGIIPNAYSRRLGKDSVPSPPLVTFGVVPPNFTDPPMRKHCNVWQTICQNGAAPLTDPPSISPCDRTLFLLYSVYSQRPSQADSDRCLEALECLQRRGWSLSDSNGTPFFTILSQQNSISHYLDWRSWLLVPCAQCSIPGVPVPNVKGFVSFP